MDQHTRESTRVALHGVAELVLAGPQHRTSGTIRLRVVPGGFATVAAPDLRVDRLDLVGPAGRCPLQGTFRELASRVGVEPRSLDGVYADGCGVDVDDPVEIDPDAGAEILTAFATGDTALRLFAPGAEPVLWPEHFDLAVTLEEVNYGISPGDDHVAEPYAYVGPWRPRQGDFWNRSFGATRRLRDVPDVESLVGFWRTGARRAATDPPA